MTFVDDILAVAYRQEMRRQHQESGATEVFWPVRTGWTARVTADGAIVVCSPNGAKWRWSVEP